MMVRVLVTAGAASIADLVVLGENIAQAGFVLTAKKPVQASAAQITVNQDGLFAFNSKGHG